MNGLIALAQLPPLTVSGQVVNQNGVAVPNHEVFVALADSANPVYQIFTAITGTNGNYNVTIPLNSNTADLYVVYTYGDCGPVYYSQFVQSSVTNAVVNFQICLNGLPTTPCHAAFTYNPDPGMICIGGGPGLSFSDNSQASGTIISWEWNFGNGAVSTDENPDWCFMLPGIYFVCLTITTDSGCTDQFCQNVYAGDSIINPPPCQANFYYGNPAGTTQSQFFDASLGNPDSWFWDFGDGTTSNQQNPVHVFPQTGFYNVCLTISAFAPNGNINCTSTFCDQIFFQGNNQNGCDAFFTTGDSILCYVGWGLQFYDISNSIDPIINWYWDFGDGNTSVDQNPVNCFSNPGTYEVCLTIETDSCTDQYCQLFTFPDSIPNPNCESYFNYYNGGTNSGLYFWDESFGGAIDWFWQFGDGTSSTLQNPVHFYQAAGFYDVCLTIYTSAGCVDDYCQQVYYDPNNPGSCEAFFSYQSNPAGYYFWFMNQTYAVAGIYYSYWSFGDGTNSIEPNPQHEYSTPGTYEVCLNIVTPDSCSDSYCESIVIGGGTYSVSGNVYANGNLVSNAAVLLMGETGSIYSESVSSGYYEFTNVAEDTYIIYAIPSFVQYPNYVPTYYESSVFWVDAIEVPVSDNVTGADINLIGFNWLPTGTGTITGNVVWNDSTSTSTYKDRLGPSVEDITILLMTLDDNVLIYTSTDAQGYFEFKTLPYGTYKVYTELTGHITYPAIVTLDETNYTVQGIQIIINGSTIVVGIDDSTENSTDNFSVFPNPVNDLLNLSILSNKPTDINVAILNALGQTVHSEVIHVNSGNHLHQVNVSKLPGGIYYTRLTSGSEQPSVVKFIK